MSRLRIFLGTLALTCIGSVARADIPPPPGETRVDYRFQVDAIPDGHAAIAFPAYDPGSNGLFVTLQANKDVPSYQGYTPGIYVLPTADAAALSGKDHDALKRLLDASARRCLKQIPRVFQVRTELRISRMTDVIHLAATATACEARLVRTIYDGPSGEHGEGGIDAKGRRTPPAPFGDALPNVSESGLVLAATAHPPTPAKDTVAAPPAKAEQPSTEQPAKSGSCSIDPDGDRSPVLLALPVLALLRRRR